MKRLIFLIFTYLPIAGFSQIWVETFSGLADDITADNGVTKWSTIQPSPTGGDKLFQKRTYPGYEIIAVNNTINEGIWTSEEIDISSATEVAIEITWGSYWANSTDYLRAYYKIDDGAEVLFGEETGKPDLQVASAASAIVSGEKVQIIIKGKENTAGMVSIYPRMMGIDDVTVSELTYLYSRQSGNWDNTNTWSTTGYNGTSCSCTPNENTHVFVGNGKNVNLNSSAEAAGVTIESTGRINYTANAQLDIVRGGVLEIADNGSIDRNGNTASVTFATYNYDIAVDGELSVDNLTIDAANATFTGSGNVTIAGDLSVNNTVSKTIITAMTGTFTVGDDILFNSLSNNFIFNNTGNLTVNDLILFGASNVDFYNNGTLNIGSGGILVNDSDDEGIGFDNFGTLSLGAINLNGADFELDNYGTINQSGDFSNVTAGSAFNNLSGSEWNFSGSGTNAQLFTSAANNTFRYTRSGDQTVFVPADGAYDQLVISGSGTKTVAGDVSVNDDIYIEGTSSLDMSVNSYDLTIAGDWIVTSSSSDPFAERSSNVTFNGSADQTLSTVFNTEAFNQLTIDKSGSNVILSSSPTTKLMVVDLDLVEGGLDLNGNRLDISWSSSAAISRTNGYIISETSASPYSRVEWSVGTGTGAYIFPFGTEAGDYIPFIFDITTGGKGSGIVAVATYATTSDNTPYPAGVANLNGTDGYDISDDVVDRFWQIDLSDYTANPTSTVTFTATSAEVGSNSSLRAQRWNSSQSKWDAPLADQANPNLYSVEVPNVTQFSPWTLSDGASQLPVELLDFRAFSSQRAVVLEWKTSQEVNNDYFTVEKTRDFETFYEVGVIQGMGNTAQPHDYKLKDNLPFPGLSYYRIKQTDFDGTTEVFKPVSVNWEGEHQMILLYPNPTNGESISIAMTDFDIDESLTVEIYDAKGQLIHFNSPADTKIYSGGLDILFNDPLSRGIYFIKIGDSIVEKFVVE